MRRRAYLGCVLIAAVTWTAPAHSADLSGTYVAKVLNAAVLLQVVESSDHHLTGRYEQVVLQPNGTLSDTNAGVSGAADAGTVVLTIKPNELLAPGMAASGTVEGNVLHLSGGGGMDLYLIRSDEAAFRAQVAQLSQRGQRVIAAKNEAEVEKREADSLHRQVDFVNSLVKRMWAFDAKASESLPKFRPIEQRYSYITQRMQAALQRERSIFGDYRAQVARSQIYVAIDQAAISANSLHIQVDSSRQTFDFTSKQLLNDTQTAEQYCQGMQTAPAADSVASARDSLHAACGQFSEKVGQFRKNQAALRQAFAHAEEVWQSEHREQDSIVQASERASH